MRVTVVSGKGGVGKSMIASALAVLFSKRQDVVAIDCDVDAPNLALWLGIDTSNPKLAKITKPISTVSKPVIDKERCIGCGSCIQSCSFDALELNDKGKAELIAYKCEGCGLCEILCPEKAISLRSVDNCTLSQFDTKWGFPVIQGQIKPGEAESGEAVTEIRKFAEKLGDKDTVFVQDAAAGIGCPVIASIGGSDYIILVAEPSKSSISDMKRALKVVNHFKVPFGVVVNKSNLNEELTQKIKSEFQGKVLGEIGYDRKVVESIVDLQPVLESESTVKEEVTNIFEKIKVSRDFKKYLSI